MKQNMLLKKLNFLNLSFNSIIKVLVLCDFSLYVNFDMQTKNYLKKENKEIITLNVSSDEFYTGGGGGRIPSPFAPSLLVTSYDTQRIRWRYSYGVIACHHRSVTPMFL